MISSTLELGINFNVITTDENYLEKEIFLLDI